MSILGRVADAAAAALVGLAGLTSPSAWSTRVAGRLASMTITVSDDLDYTFLASSPLLLWRAQTLFQKEPETIAWIRSFSGDDIFYDVGANVGTFTIYAGRRGAHVFAFEPESANFSILNQNIALNRLSDRIRAFPLAIAEGIRLDSLRLASLNPGAALHAFGNNFDFKGEQFIPAFEQGCLALPLDDLVARLGLPQPTRLKIDVDGLERQVIAGASNILSDSRLRDVLVEINENDQADREMIGALDAIGLRVATIGEPVTDMTGKSRMRNVILRRNAG